MLYTRLRRHSLMSMSGLFLETSFRSNHLSLAPVLPIKTPCFNSYSPTCSHAHSKRKHNNKNCYSAFAYVYFYTCTAIGFATCHHALFYTLTAFRDNVTSSFPIALAFIRYNCSCSTKQLFHQRGTTVRAHNYTTARPPPHHTRVTRS